MNERPPATAPRVPLSLAPGASLELDGTRLALVEITLETIAADPSNPTAYPPGSGATVTVTLAGERGVLTLLSAGYTSTSVAWLGAYRVELVGADHRGAELHVDRVTDRVLARQPIQLRRGETARIHDREVTFHSHGHKMVEAGTESPLLVRVAFDGRDEHTYSLFPSRKAVFHWQDLRFTLVAYEYDSQMELVVDRLALEPVTVSVP